MSAPTLMPWWPGLVAAIEQGRTVDVRYHGCTVIRFLPGASVEATLPVWEQIPPGWLGELVIVTRARAPMVPASEVRP